MISESLQVRLLAKESRATKRQPTKRAATVLKVRGKTIFLVGRLRQVHVAGRVIPIGDEPQTVGTLSFS